MEVYLPALLGKYGGPTDRRTDGVIWKLYFQQEVFVLLNVDCFVDRKFFLQLLYVACVQEKKESQLHRLHMLSSVFYTISGQNQIDNGTVYQFNGIY